MLVIYWCSGGKYKVSWEGLAMLHGPKRDQMEHGGGGMTVNRVSHGTQVWNFYPDVGRGSGWNGRPSSKGRSKKSESTS